ncbi:MAG: hypothetical protein KF795_13090 [Labilithrix sp.]|nr:hypothetical protein [Labilithrix sp.]
MRSVLAGTGAWVLVSSLVLGSMVGCSTDPGADAGQEQGDEETDVGCGGKNAPPCPESKRCKVNLDCASQTCVSGTCGPSKDGTASGCKGADDCASKVCLDGACKPAAPDDGVKNDDETDIDCGGAKAPKCGDGKGCGVAEDCESSVCTSGACAAPSPTDGVQNGGETDIDCGGPNAPKCELGKACVAHGDCASDGCGYDQKCALARSCTARFGGDTCGAGEVGDPNAQHESCCTAIPLTNAANSKKLDKYSITAGRMRAFVERFDGNIKGFVSSLGANHADWDQAWTANMPSNMDQLNIELGPYGIDGQRQGCYLNGQGARTYWMPDAVNTSFSNEIAHKYGKDVLDAKALQCATFFMMQAMCIWDGGRLATLDELDAQWGGTYPWGAQGWTSDRAVHKFTYGFPENRLDNTAYIAAPGRKPAGNGPKGHADLGGLVFNITSTFDANGRPRWSRNGSWENHAIPYGATFSPKTRAYWAAGGRCTRN